MLIEGVRGIAMQHIAAWRSSMDSPLPCWSTSPQELILKAT